MEITEIESDLDRHERAYRWTCLITGVVHLAVIARACCLEM